MPETSETTQFTKRDQFEIEKVAGIPLGAMFRIHDGQQYPTAEYMMAAKYVAEKKNDLTDLDYQDWLDEQHGDVEVEVDPT